MLCVGFSNFLLVTFYSLLVSLDTVPVLPIIGSTVQSDTRKREYRVCYPLFFLRGDRRTCPLKILYCRFETKKVSSSRQIQQQ